MPNRINIEVVLVFTNLLVFYWIDSWNRLKLLASFLLSGFDHFWSHTVRVCFVCVCGCACGWVGTHKVCVRVHARWRKREKERRNLKGNGNFDFFGRKNRNKTWKQLVRLRPLMCGTDSVDPEANQKWTTRSYFLHDLADYWEANGLCWHMVLS